MVFNDTVIMIHFSPQFISYILSVTVLCWPRKLVCFGGGATKIREKTIGFFAGWIIVGNAKKMTRLSCHFTLLLFQIRVGQKPRIPYYFLANKNLWELGLGNMVISLNVSHWIDRKTARFFVSFHISRIGNHRFLPTAEKWLHFPANRLISPCNPTTSFFNLL